MEGDNCWFRSVLHVNCSSMLPLQMAGKKKKKVMHPAMAKSCKVKACISYKLKVYFIFPKGRFNSLSKKTCVTQTIPECSCDVYIYVCIDLLQVVWNFEPETYFWKLAFLLRFFTLYIFMIAPLNNFLPNKTITAFLSLLIGKKSYFPSSHLQLILLSFSEFCAIFFLLF